MKPRVWMDVRLYPAAQRRLEAVADIVGGGNLDLLPGVDAAIISSLVDAGAAFMDRAGPQLKAIARPGIGVDNIDIAAATERGILVINTPDGPTESTAEHAVALLLALAKRVVVSDARFRASGWGASRERGTEVAGRTLGVVGFGRIGRRVAEICGQGLLMRILAYDPFIDWAHAQRSGMEITNDLDALLVQSDFVTLHTALTNETRHMIGERELRLMKPGTYLINVSRGPVIDEQALIKVLQEGHLAGVALDVFDPEPPLPDNPLFKMSNVVVTPHIASYTDLGGQKMGDAVADQIVQVLRGERPPFLLNPSIWPGRVAAGQPR